MKRGSRIAVLSVAAILITVPAGQSRRAEAAQAKQVTFMGKVLDAAGQPLEGVKVRRYQETSPVKVMIHCFNLWLFLDL